MNIYKKILASVLKETAENTICSPITIYQIMLLLSEITNGDTRKEIMTALELDDLSEVRAASNGIFKENVRFQEVHHDDIENSLFKAYPQARHIPYEQWISDQIQISGMSVRHDVLKSLAKIYHIDTDQSVPSTSEPWMQILSSFVFKTQWRDKFNPENTSMETFHGRKSETTVEMMHRTYNSVYYSGDEYSMIKLLIDRAGSMTFILPDHGVDIDSISPDTAIISHSDEETSAFKSEYVRIHAGIPKFSIRSSLGLNSAFKSMGVSLAFNPDRSDFSTIFYDNAYISNVRHSTKLEIDENGISGVAYVRVELLGAPPPPKKEVEFIVDRPFLFCITGRNGELLFAGKVYDI